MIMENLGCNYSYFSFSVSCYAYILEFTDFAFDAKSEHIACLKLHLKIAFKGTFISSFLYHFIKQNFGHKI